MHDRPTAEELVRAVIAFLDQELLPTITDQRLRFRGLVANNVLSIITRELAAGDTALRAERGQLLALLDQPEGDTITAEQLRRSVAELSRELCTRIRNGEYDSEPQFTIGLDYARETVIAKLRVANPRAIQ
jgi:hypothetical protein